MGTYIIMVGVPGSGKTTVAAKLKEMFNAEVFSSDEYRKKLLGADTDQSQNAYVFECLYKDLREHLKNGGSAILDATNISLKGRRQSLEVCKGIDCKKIAYVVNTPIFTCIERDKQRERTVGEDVIWKFIKRFDYPCLCEGFDEVLIWDSHCEPIKAGSDEDAVLKMVKYDQNNHHHSHTLDVHTDEVAKNYNECSPEYCAALYHDVGKVYTRTTDENGESHYYSHANVSAYWTLSHIGYVARDVYEKCKDFELMMFLINYHMRANDIVKSEKATKKYTKIFGEEYMEKLKLFNINDFSAK